MFLVCNYSNYECYYEFYLRDPQVETILCREGCNNKKFENQYLNGGSCMSSLTTVDSA